MPTQTPVRATASPGDGEPATAALVWALHPRAVKRPAEAYLLPTGGKGVPVRGYLHIYYLAETWFGAAD